MATSCSSGEATKEKVFLGGCKVCGDVASGKYFGALVCVPCKVGGWCGWRLVWLQLVRLQLLWLQLV